MGFAKCKELSFSNLNEASKQFFFLLPEDTVDLYHPGLSGHDSADHWVLQGVC